MNKSEQEKHIQIMRGRLLECTINFIKQTEGTLSPDNKAAEMATWSELKEIQSPHVDELNAGQVAESLDNAIALVVDHKGTAALTMSAVPELSFASTEFTRVGDLDDVGVPCMRGGS